MRDTISASKNQFDELVNSMKRIEHLLARLIKTQERNTPMTEEAAKRYKETYVYEEGEPEYGTDAWWEWSDAQALEDIKEGRYTTVKTKEELQTFLDRLK